MTSGGDVGSDAALAPDNAFAILGNETRIRVLQVLGEIDEALSFTELRERVGLEDPGQFNYHLNQLIPHFIRRTDRGYKLREPGSIVVQAVHSGLVTRSPVIEPSILDIPCPYCGSNVEVSFKGWVMVRCLECPATYSGSKSDVLAIDSHPHGTIATYPLPPAGLDERTSKGMLKVAMSRMHHELLAMAHGICPLCSGVVTPSLQVCHDHQSPPDVCEQCHRRHALHVDHHCTNCIRVDENIPLGLHLVRVPEIMAFMGSNGVNPIYPDWEELSVHYDYDEQVQRVDPFEACLTYHIGDSDLSITVNENLEIIEMEQSGT